MSLLEHYPDMLTVQEAADILWTDTAGMCRMMKAGKISFAEIAGKPLIPRQFLEKFIEKSCQMCYN